MTDTNNAAANTNAAKTAPALAWVDRLPQIGGPNLARVAAIRENYEEAQALSAQADALRAQAYRDTLRLEGELSKEWTAAEIDAAKNPR